MNSNQYILAKDWRFWAVIVLIALIICGMGIAFIVRSIQNVVNAPFEDPNGPDDPSLTTITLDEIVSTSGDYTAVMSGSSHSGSGTRVRGNLGDYDYDRCSFRCKRIDGIKTLQATRVRSSSLTLEIDSTLTSGNMEIVILVDGEYHSHVEVNSFQQIRLEDVEGKTVVVRMAAEGAEAELNIRRR